MLEVDFHSHSIFSDCGVHSVVELLEQAKKNGMYALAVTDHGPELPGRVSNVFYDRLKQPVEGIRLLKGIECNLTGEKGKIDLPSRFIKDLDIILLGIHPNTPPKLGLEVYTDLLIAAIEENPLVDVLTHLNDKTYLVDFKKVALAAKKLGITVEINNSKTMLQRITDDITLDLLNACIETECPVVINSDAHVLSEVGRNEDVLPLLSKVNFPEELILNKNKEEALDFVEKRRKIKEKYL